MRFLLGKFILAKKKETSSIGAVADVCSLSSFSCGNFILATKKETSSIGAVVDACSLSGFLVVSLHW